MRPIHFSLFVLFLFSVLSVKSQISNDSIPRHDSFTITSHQLSEIRKINIWTPANYKTNYDSLPVLYMLDGGIQEDFPHIANTIAKLIEEKKINPLILVGIENTQRRKDLTGPTSVKRDKKIAPVVGGSASFRNFIKDELIPEINKRYHTKEKKGIIGESLAGLFITETFLLTPDLFDTYIAFDPSLWWNNEYLVKHTKAILKSFTTKRKIFWFAASGEETIADNVKQLSEILKTSNKENILWNYLPQPNEKHSTIFRATKEKALTWALNQL